MKHFLDRISKNDLREFLDLYSQVVPFDMDDYYEKALDIIKFYDGKAKSNEIINALEKQWYISLREHNMPDYTLYNNKLFVLDMWACWKLYSRNYIRNMANIKNKIDGEKLYEYFNKRVNTIVDVGCGIGYSSIALHQLFNARVFATNIKGSAQYAFCEILFKGFNGVALSDNVKRIADYKKRCDETTDMVFASEYFEHFADPIGHATVVINSLKPKFIVMANAFGADAIGHFDEYPVGDNKVEGRLFGRYFNNNLRELGYESLETGFFNNRPTVFKRNDVR